MAAKEKVLSELEFDTQYRFPIKDNYSADLEWFHRVPKGDGFVARPANIHSDATRRQAQFELDALHGLAYVKAEVVVDNKSPNERYNDAIMKEGTIVETAPNKEEEVSNQE